MNRNNKILIALGAVGAFALTLGACMAGMSGVQEAHTTEKIAAVPASTIPVTSDPNDTDQTMATSASAATVAAHQPTSDDGVDPDDALDATDDSDDVPPPAAPSGSEGGQLEPPDEPVDLEPGVSQPTGPCAGLAEGGSSLVAGPDPLVLDPGVYDGTVLVINCGEQAVDVAVASKPSISLGTTAAVVGPDETIEVDFTIDKAAWSPGAIDFKIKVSIPGENHYVDVHAYRPLTGADLVGGSGGLTIGEDADGCAQQCIVSAQLDPHWSTADVGLDITTNAEAKLRTYLSLLPPAEVDGHPNFPGIAPRDTSPAGLMSHRAELTSLSPATKYYIIVSATDDDGQTSYRSGSFTTNTPVDHPGDLAPTAHGCALQCITSALVSPGDHTSRRLDVTASTAAQFQVAVSTEPPVDGEDGPVFAENDLWLNSGLEFAVTWQVDLTELTPGTAYYVIVTATDIEGGVDKRTGQFSTPAAPSPDATFSLYGIHVDDDGDSGGLNRGELSFAWRVGDDQAGFRSEQKLNDGDWTGMPRAESSFVAADVVSFLPTVYVTAFERDPDGKVEFCSVGFGADTDDGSSGACDVVWSTASSGIVAFDILDTFPLCSELGFVALDPAERCMALTTGGQAQGGRPEFTAYVGVVLAG